LPRAASPVTGGSRAAAAPRLAAVDSLAGRGGPPHHELRALIHRDTAVATPVAGPGDRPGPGRDSVSLGRLLRPLYGDDDDARRDHRGRKRRRRDVEAVRVPLEAGRRQAPARLRSSAPAAAGLADVVRGARPLRRQSLVRLLRAPPRRRLSSGPRLAGAQPFPQRPAPLPPQDDVRLPLHRLHPPPPDRRLVATRAARPVLPIHAEVSRTDAALSS